ncbi:hypothetical protein D3C85_1419350 [compost metagenome]
MLSAIGEQYTSLFGILLHADGALAELGDPFGQLAGQGVEEVGTVYRRLPYPFGQAGAQITGIFTTTPFEPDVLPGILRLVGNLAVGFGNTQARDGTNGIGAEGDTCSNLAEGWSRFEQLHAQVRMTAQVQGQGHAGDTAANDADLQFGLRSTHSKLPMRLIVIGVARSSLSERY